MLVKTKKPVVGCCSAHWRSATDQLVNTGMICDGLRTGWVVVEHHQPATLKDLVQVVTDIEYRRLVG